MRRMEIANPIYDVVFKYLMQDDSAARLLVGRIAELDVRALDFRPQEAAVHSDALRGDLPLLTLLRMDFAARVRTADGGQRQVLIEIQKTNAPTVIERFRLYLGEQYRSRSNLAVGASGRADAVPLVTIYLLGYDLGLSDEAVVDVCPQVRERRTGRELDAGHPFVAGLHHRSHIVQIPRLARRRRDSLERFLSIFDQGLVAAEREDNHVLSLEESEYPSEGGAVLRRLRLAAAEEQVRRNMEGEDLLLRDSIIYAQQAEREKQRAEQPSSARSRPSSVRSRPNSARSRPNSARSRPNSSRPGSSPDSSGICTAEARAPRKSPRRWRRTRPRCGGSCRSESRRRGLADFASGRLYCAFTYRATAPSRTFPADSRADTIFRPAHALEDAGVNVRAFGDLARPAAAARPETVEGFVFVAVRTGAEPRQPLLVHPQSAGHCLLDHPVQGDVGQAAILVPATDVRVDPGEPHLLDGLPRSDVVLSARARARSPCAPRRWRVRGSHAPLPGSMWRREIAWRHSSPANPRCPRRQ